MRLAPHQSNTPPFPDNATPEEKDAKTVSDPSKAKKHGKAASKSTGLKYQFQIMLSMGVDLEEIHKFADSKYWLYYFPPKAIQDLKALGVFVDWRRSFISMLHPFVSDLSAATDINPYYDSFVKWQFNKLKRCVCPGRSI